jgi:hypothetical protein
MAVDFLLGSAVGWAVLNHVAWQSTLETHTKILTSLRGRILLVRGCRMRGRWNILPRLLHDLTGCLLQRVGLWKIGMLRLKVGTLHQEMGMLILKLQTRALHRRTTHEWGSEKLTRLRDAIIPRFRKRRGRSFHMCAQDVQITCTTNSKANSLQCYNCCIITVYRLQNDPWV